MAKTIKPKVNEVQEFIEIASDFSNPLDLVREAISNSYDAQATRINISFGVIKEAGEDVLRIKLKDDGLGIEEKHLQNFFDLGNSTRRNDEKTIGEKGHGTKVYFNSKKIELKTSTGATKHHYIMNNPCITLYDGKVPLAQPVDNSKHIGKGTEIIIDGYNNNRREKFNHENLKDYIIWFTKHGSIENQFSEPAKKVRLFLKGLGRDDFEEIEQGHYFPEESQDINKLFDDYSIKAPDFYSKKIKRTGSLKNFPEIKYEAVFSIEGKRIKYSYNKMIRRQRHTAPEGSYLIRDRYGLWLCKDYIPIQRENEWISTKGTEFTRFHAFVNCQNLRLTANRGSVDNTPSEILQDLQDSVRKIYEEITTGEAWSEIDWLEGEALGCKTSKNEQTNFDRRIKKINRSNVAQYKGLTLVEPQKENGVYSLFLLLSQVDKSLFPFQIIDYDTHEGIDVIAKEVGGVPIKNSKLYYVEFKSILQKRFNHSFENLHSVVCWDTEIKHGDIVEDIAKQERKMEIAGIAPKNKNDYTHYYLSSPRSGHKIEVFCLKDYLREKLNLQFRPRTSSATI